MTTNHILSVTGKHQLKDGFQELFIFRGHRLQLRGFNLVEWLEDARRGGGGGSDGGSDQYKLRFHFYISWDVKQVLLWKHDSQSFGSKPQLLNQVKFSNQPNYVCAIVHVTKMKVFLAAALDMSFKIFDRHLNLLESIRHEERAILELEYDSSKDLIFSSGATGISVWKLYRNLSLDKSHVMEKLYTFDGCDTWITHMIYEPQFNRIYALKERSAQVLSLTRRAVITTLENVHDAPINTICWYERNQFYLTGCSRGEVKCWTSNFNYRKATSNDTAHATAAFNQFSHHQEDGNNDDLTNDTQHHHTTNSTSAGKKFALLHTFKGHTKAVTAIKLHPVSGLAISISLDGFVKILNLESLNELFTIQCDAGILNMRILNLGTNHHACLFAFTDATIRLWKITSVCDFFAVTSAKIDSFQTFDNLEGELEYYHRTNKHNINTSILKSQFGEYRMTGLFGGNNNNSLNNSAVNNGNSNAVVKSNANALNNNNSLNNAVMDEDYEEMNLDKGLDTILAEKIIITESSQDVRAFTHTGTLLGRLEPEHVVDGILAYTVSVHQKLFISISEGDKIRVHCLRRFGFPLLFETNLKGPLGMKPHGEEAAGGSPTAKGHSSGNDSNTTEILDQLASCITLIDIAPNNAIRSPRNNASYDEYDHHSPGYGTKTDIRGETVPDFMECFVVIGLNTGTILFLDLYHHLEVILSFQAIHGIICDLKYRKRFHELFMYGKDFTQTLSTIRIFKLPELELISNVQELKSVSCFNISPTLNYFGIGCSTGAIRLFTHHVEDSLVQEVIRSSENHDGVVTSMCFYDEIRVYITSSKDSTINIWDFEKRLIRSVILNMETVAVIPNGFVGDVVMSQNHYLLTISRRVWDEDDFLNTMNNDPSEDQGGVNTNNGPEFADDGSTSQKSRAKDADAANEQGDEGIDEKSQIDEPSERKRRKSQSSVNNHDNGSVISAISETTNPTYTTDTRKTAIKQPSQPSGPPPTAGNKRSTLADRRMSKRITQMESKKRFSVMLAKQKTTNPTTVLPFLNNKPADSASSNGADSDEDDTTVEEEKKAVRIVTPETSFDKLVDCMKELFEKEVVLPQLQDTTCEFVKSSQQNKANHNHTTNNKDSMSKFDSSSLDQQHHHHHRPPQQIPSTFESISNSDLKASSSPFQTIFGESIPKPSKPSSTGNGSYDTLHPKFILHKKPPARAMKLEDIEAKLLEYKLKINHLDPDTLDPLKNLSVSSRIHTRRFAQFGLSPRARLTLLNSHEMEDSSASLMVSQSMTTPSPDQPLHQLPPQKQQQSVSPPNLRKTSVFAHRALDLSAAENEKTMEANLELRLQEQLVMGLGIGMKVSSQFKQQRLTLKRNDTFTQLEKRIQSMSKFPGVEGAVEGGVDNDKVLNSRSPRGGFRGRNMMPGGTLHSSDIDMDVSIVDDEWEENEGQGDKNEIILSEDLKGGNSDEVQELIDEQKNDQSELLEEQKNDQLEILDVPKEKTIAAPAPVYYNRRKPLLPASFNPKEIR